MFTVYTARTGDADLLTHLLLHNYYATRLTNTMVNTLAGKAGLKLGPVLLETLVKHYFERLGHEHDEKTKLQTTQLRKDELLYDEAFNVVKVRSSPADLPQQLTHRVIDLLRRIQQVCTTPSPLKRNPSDRYL